MAEKQQKNWFVRHKVLAVVGAVFLLIIIVAIAGGGKDTASNTKQVTSNQASSTNKEDSKAQIPKKGEVAADGKFEFTITSVECGKPTVGLDQYSTKTAQGQYCLVNTTVKNIGKEAQMFDSTSQYLLDASDAKYSADSMASFYANPQGSTFLNNINPGNSVTGILVFDLPKDKSPVIAELHDSSLSGGVKINIQ